MGKEADLRSKLNAAEKNLKAVKSEAEVLKRDGASPREVELEQLVQVSVSPKAAFEWKQTKPEDRLRTLRTGLEPRKS